MKRTFLYIMMAAVLTACGHRASNNAADTDSVSADMIQPLMSDVQYQKLTVDSIGLEREDSTAIVKISIDWPVNGDEALVKSIRQYLCEELATSPNQEGKPEVKFFTDGKEAVNYAFKKQHKELSDGWKEMRAVSYDNMPFEHGLRSSLEEETDSYVTYLTNSEGFLGGAHGYATSTGQTFRKSDGKRLGYRTEYNQKTEKFEIKDQTLFADPKSPKLYALIKEGVRSYFLEFEEGVKNDENLKDLLIDVEDVNKIPLPSSAPYFTKDGLCFIYQQYEIAPYASGMINFTIPYDKIRQLLTEDAQDLLR